MSRRTTSIQRALDRVIGIPVVAAFALAPKRRPPRPDTVHRIGVLKSAAIGDTLLLVGTFEALRRAYPGATLTLITGPDNAAAVPYFAELIDRHVVVSPKRPLAAIAAIRAQRLDIAIECGPWPRVDALFGILSRARYRVGFRVAGQARHHGFDRVVEHSSTAHQSENFRELVRAAGASDFGPLRLGLVGDPPAERRPREPYVFIHPWSGGYMGWVKEWPADRWIELAKALPHSRIVIGGGPGDVERATSLAARLAREGVDAESVAGRYTLAELGHVLAASDVVVAVNTGVMHLAALLGAPTVCLDGPTPARRWGPVGPRARSVSSTYPGCGFLDLGFEYRGQRLDCMEGISVADVLRAIGEVRAPRRART